ncbi:non-homologous end-joining factor 1 isoform X2 [Rhineura floridana]|uniref:non-homologous end-joining factor 1 isoform X2 n=1 Tax=Rhineura floridana TaxID=261503 RepID=UPI002AC87258|nr:non-homologous end-joining factor 1 isoform X2 [Rhineura floridana]
MESTEDLESRLLLQPWTSVCFAESTKLMAKAWFGDAGYALLLSDLTNMWYEKADTEVIQQRSKELNKRLTARASSFLNHLCSLMCPLLEGENNSSTSFSCQLSPSTLTLHVKSELLGLPFYWDFHCSAAPVEMMSCHLVRPLMAMSLALQSQVRELASLLLQKDAEIEDFRESGAVLSRERLKTEPFKEESFLQTFEAEILPQACCLGDGYLFTSNLKQLYMSVTQQQAKAVCKRHREGDCESPEHASSQDHAQGAADLPTEEDKIASQSAAVQCVQDTVVPASQAQKVQLPIAKTKRKKAKGLFG